VPSLSLPTDALLGSGKPFTFTDLDWTDNKANGKVYWQIELKKKPGSSSIIDYVSFMVGPASRNLKITAQTSNDGNTWNDDAIFAVSQITNDPVRLS
jgi:hypothetical protein